MNNKKIFILITLLFIPRLKSDCGGGGNTFLAATGGSFLGSCVSNFMFRPRQPETVVVQQQPAYAPPAPEPMMVDDEMIEYRQTRMREKRRNRQLELEQRKVELELLKEENKREELALEKRRLEISNRKKTIKK